MLLMMMSTDDSPSIPQNTIQYRVAQKVNPGRIISKRRITTCQ